MGAQQRVEILKTLYRGAELLILDEPTAALTDIEVEGLFQIIHKLTEEGKSVIFISHKMREVLQISDRITILRTGEVIAKTKAGEWALQQGLCPVEKELERALQVRRSPLLYRDQPEVKRWLCTLGPAVQRFADVLEKEIARSQREQPKGILESTCCE